jgi:hypothetical protein
MRLITRQEVELYLQSSQHAKDPVIRAVLNVCLRIMRERGVDYLENDPPDRVSA